MAQRLLRTSVLGMLTFALLFGGGSAGTDFVHADPSLHLAIAFTSTRDPLPGVSDPRLLPRST